MSIADDLLRMTNADALRGWIRDGKRRKAAESARDFARTATIDELRTIVAALADGLEVIGDKYGKRKRPTKNPKKMLQEEIERITCADIRDALSKLRQIRRAAALFAKLTDAGAALAPDSCATPAQKARARDVLEPTGLIPGRTFKTLARDHAAEKVGIAKGEMKALFPTR